MAGPLDLESGQAPGASFHGAGIGAIAGDAQRELTRRSWTIS